jgi:hypothetical protein
VKDVVAIGLQNLTEGARNPLSEYNTAFCRLLTPMTDLPTEPTPGGKSPQFEPFIAESFNIDLPSRTQYQLWKTQKNNHQPMTPILLSLKELLKRRILKALQECVMICITVKHCPD